MSICVRLASAEHFWREKAQKKIFVQRVVLKNCVTYDRRIRVTEYQVLVILNLPCANRAVLGSKALVTEALLGGYGT